MRGDPRTSDTRLIALTALATSAVRENAIRAGCDAFLTKPVHVAVLRASVMEQLK
jgi:CheY-like chemotaxis protein